MKFSPSPLTLLLVAALSLALTEVSPAKGGHPLPKGKPTPPVEHHHTTISSISADSITITGKESKTYKINKDTEFTFKGQRAKLEDLKSGMRVSVTTAGDPTVAARIAADDAPKEPAKAGK